MSDVDTVAPDAMTLDALEVDLPGTDESFGVPTESDVDPSPPDRSDDIASDPEPDLIPLPPEALGDWDPVVEDARLAEDLASGFAVLGDRLGQGDHGAVHAISYVIDHPAARDVPEELRVLKTAFTTPPPFSVPEIDGQWPHTVRDFEAEVAAVRRAQVGAPQLRTADPRLVRWAAGGKEQFGISMDLVDAVFCRDLFAMEAEEPLPDTIGWEHLAKLEAIRARMLETGLKISDFQGFYVPGGEFVLIDPLRVQWTGVSEPNDVLDQFVADLEARLDRSGRPDHRGGSAAPAVAPIDPAGARGGEWPGAVDLPGGGESFGVPGRRFTANVMAPLEVTDWEALPERLAAARAAGTDAVSVDVWWGKVAVVDDPRGYEWDYYDRLFAAITDAGLKVVPILSLHECGA
ncbi:MAG: family 14 glycosylhydrolase, partial [Phycicoccus sp.]